MADPWDELAESALGVVNESLKGFLENNADVEKFAKEQAKDYAREWWNAKKAETDAERQEHEANLKHLVAQARGRARRLQIAISTEAKDVLGRVLETVGNMLITVAPKILAIL